MKHVLLLALVLTSLSPVSVSAASDTLTITSAPCAGSNVVATCDEPSLRAAIAQGGNVRICCNGTITLPNTIVITNSVTLDASDRSVTIDGNHTVRLFQITSNVTFSATNLTLANGYHLGAAATATEPAGVGRGAAILNDGGRVNLISCLLTNNQSKGGVGTSFTFNSEQAQGGAIWNSGDLVLRSVVAVSNVAWGGEGYTERLVDRRPGGSGRGGVLYNAGGIVSLTGTTFSNNAAFAPTGASPIPEARGGSIYQENGTMTLSNSTIVDSLATGYVIGSRSTTHIDGIPPHAFGGAAYIENGWLNLYRSVIQHSRAISGQASGPGSAPVPNTGGGALFLASQTTNLIRDSFFTSNEVSMSFYSINSGTNFFTRGGALYNLGQLTVLNSTFHTNTVEGLRQVGMVGGPAEGGAIYNASAVAITNSTFAGNLARGGASQAVGGSTNVQSGSATGGGLHHASGNASLMNVTFSGNRVQAGFSDSKSPPVLRGAQVAAGASLTFKNTILSDGQNLNGWGQIVDGGHNMSSDSSIPLNSGRSFSSTDPRLFPLAYTGGFTPTMSLQADSPAIDFADSTAAPVTDQRGVPRPYGAGFDIGAFEFSGSGQSILTIGRVGSSIRLTFPTTAGFTYDLQRSTNLTSWQPMETVGPQSIHGRVVRTIPATQAIEYFRVKND